MKVIKIEAEPCYVSGPSEEKSHYHHHSQWEAALSSLKLRLTLEDQSVYTGFLTSVTQEV